LQRKTVKMYQLAHDVYHHLLLKGVAKMFLVRQRQRIMRKKGYIGQK
jgi:hypothetical protein